MNDRRVLYRVVTVVIGTIGILGSILAFNYLYVFDPRCDCALRTKNDCGVIVDALRRYQQEEKSLPRTLESLVPSYLEVLPKVRYGRPEWFYHQLGGEFTVGFTAVDGYPGCYYSSRIRDWYIDE